MRTVPADIDSALTGSRAGEGVLAHAWYDGQVVAADLPVEDWSVSWDASRQVQGQLDVTVRDPDGLLAPWAVDDPLGVGGSRLQVVYRLASGATVDLGWFRITGNDPQEEWRTYRVNDSTATGDGELAFFKERLEWVSGGAVVPVSADELTRQASIERFLAPESPPLGATVLSEVRRLLDGIMTVTVAPGVVDASVSRSVVYEQERMDAVEDLLNQIGCSHRMTGFGQFEVYPNVRTTPVWQVAGGDDGVLIRVSRSQRLDGLYNGAVSEGEDAQNRPLIGRWFEEGGPLRWGGPHGRYPVFHSATGLLKTQQAVNADARTRLSSVVSQRSVVLEVTCLPHPGLQLGDWVVVANPTVAGSAVPLAGVVRQMRLAGSADAVEPMVLAVECSFTDVQAVRGAIDRAA